MDSLYRICTEDLNRAGIECIMQNAGLDCTIIPARGIFCGIPEDSLVIECVTSDDNAVTIAARAIKIANRQTCILVERLAVSARMIGDVPEPIGKFSKPEFVSYSGNPNSGMETSHWIPTK